MKDTKRSIVSELRLAPVILMGISIVSILCYKAEIPFPFHAFFGFSILINGWLLRKSYTLRIGRIKPFCWWHRALLIGLICLNLIDAVDYYYPLDTNYLKWGDWYTIVLETSILSAVVAWFFEFEIYEKLYQWLTRRS